MQRIVLDVEDFRALIRGKVVTKPQGVGEHTQEIILSDIGWAEMVWEVWDANHEGRELRKQKCGKGG